MAGRWASGWAGGYVSAAPCHPANSIRILTLDAECFEGRSIWTTGDLQIVLVLERSQRSSSLWPHATVNREFSAIGIECRLDTFNKLLVRHAPVRRGGRRRRRRPRRCSRSSGRCRRWSRSGLVLTRCTADERTGNHDSGKDAQGNG